MIPKSDFMIIKYFEENGQKTFDVVQALRDGEWGIELKDLLGTSKLELVSRHDPEYKVTVKEISLNKLLMTYLVMFEERFWLCLDHAIEQFAKK